MAERCDGPAVIVRVRRPSVGAVLLAVFLLQPYSGLAQSALLFGSDAGLILNYVAKEKAQRFEEIVGKVHAGLLNSDDPRRRAQAENWRSFQAIEPGPDGATIFVFMADPMVPRADYNLFNILAELFPDEAESLASELTGCYSLGQSVMNLRLLDDLSGQALERFQPRSTPSVSPITPTPQATPAATGKDFEILSIESQVTERNDTWWRFAWKLTVANNTAQSIALDAQIEFQNSGGFIVDTDRSYGLVVPAYGQQVFTGDALVRMPGAATVERTYAKVGRGR